MNGMDANPYQAAAAERAIIGCLLGNDVKLADIDLTVEDFQDMVCREIFSTMLALGMQGKPHDLTTVIDNCGIGNGTLIDIMIKESAVSVTLIPKHVRSVKEASVRRAIKDSAKALTEMSGDLSLDVLTSLETMRTRLDELTNGVPTAEVSNMVDMMQNWYRSRSEKETGPVFKTGIVAVDRVLNGGIRGSKLVIIGARPGVGKSAFGLWIAMKAAQDGKKILFVSLEMDETEILDRIVARYSGVEVGRFEARDLSVDEWCRISEGLHEISPMQIMITSLAQTVEQIRSLAMKIRHTRGLDLIVVDYLQLVETGRKYEGRTEQVGYISRQLKMLTMELKIPVIAMTQFNRESETGTAGNRRPKISESRESGSIEQDANVFIVMHKPDETQLSKEKHKEFYRGCKAKGWDCIELCVAKNRNGRTGVGLAAFDGAHMTYYGLDESLDAQEPKKQAGFVAAFDETPPWDKEQ